MGRPIYDITGRKFGRLTPIKVAERHASGVVWLCKCDCGNEAYVYSWNLVAGHSKSCGCLKKWGELI